LKIWVDLANSPQVLFFRPLIERMQSEGHEVAITSRHFAQTTQLADRFGLIHAPVGGHGGKKLGGIGFKLLERSFKLIRFAKDRRFDLAFSHNSYAQALAASMLSIPFVTTMDYEHQPANHLCFRLARRVIVPSFFPTNALHWYGANPAKTIYYQGLKEQVYLQNFIPIPRFREILPFPKDRILVVMRPPGSWGLYHNFENPLFDLAMEYVLGHPKAVVVFLPRVSSQASMIPEQHKDRVHIPEKVLDGPQLLYHADLVIGGGGTMNREAAVLGTPVYSLFMGKIAAVDSYLIQKKCMTHIHNAEGVRQILIQRKESRTLIVHNDLADRIVHSILTILEE
jgi:predicted glycosyltransferase